MLISCLKGRTASAGALKAHRNLYLIAAANFKTRMKYKHPADRLKTKLPPVDDRTEWIRDDITEYYQIRKKIRIESDEYIKNVAMAAFEHRVQQDMTRENFAYDDPSEEDKFRRKFTFGDVTNEQLDEKALVKSKEIVFPQGMIEEHILPTKLINQLKTLLPYIGKFKDPEDFLYATRNASIAATIRREKRCEEYNKLLEKKHEELVQRFDNDALSLIDEAVSARESLAKDQKVLETVMFQEVLRKWNGLKNDFHRPDIGQGVISEKDQKNLSDENKEEEEEKMEEVEGERVKTRENTKHDEFLALQEKIHKQTKLLCKEEFSIEEAQNLLSDESIEGLVDSMKEALENAQKMLLHKMVSENDSELKRRMESKQKNIKSFLKADYFENERQIYLEDMKRNRYLDPAVRLREVLDNDKLTKRQRMTRKFYDKLKAKIFEERDAHLRLLPARKEDFEHLDEDVKITMMTQSIHEAGSDRQSLEGRLDDRIVTLNVKVNKDLKKIMKNIFPDNYKYEIDSFVVIGNENSTKHMNKRVAFLKLSKMIHEAKLLQKMKSPKDWESYQNELSEADFDEYKPKTPTYTVDFFRKGRQDAVRIQKETMKELIKEITTTSKQIAENRKEFSLSD